MASCCSTSFANASWSPPCALESAEGASAVSATIAVILHPYTQDSGNRCRARFTDGGWQMADGEWRMAVVLPSALCPLPSAQPLLLGQHFLEPRLHLLDELPVSLRIDKVPRRDLRLQIEEVAVRCEEDVGMEGAQRPELSAIVVRDGRVLLVADEFVAVRNRRTADEDDGVSVRFRRPGRAAGRVAGGNVRGHRDAAEGDGLAVFDDAIGDDRRVEEAIAEIRIVFPAARVLRAITLAGDELRMRDALQLRDAAGVIVVRVAAEDVLDVGDFESELLDVRANHRRGLFEAAVEEEVTLRRGDEIRRDVGRSDVIDIADDAERFDRLVPGARRRFFLGADSRGKHQKHEQAFHTDTTTTRSFCTPLPTTSGWEPVSTNPDFA